MGYLWLTSQSCGRLFMRKPIPFTRISRRSMRKTIPFMRINDLECKRMCSDVASLIIESVSDKREVGT